MPAWKGKERGEGGKGGGRRGQAFGVSENSLRKNRRAIVAETRHSIERVGDVGGKGGREKKVENLKALPVGRGTCSES